VGGEPRSVMRFERGGGCGRGGAVGGDPPLVFREAAVDQGDRPAHRSRSQHDRRALRSGESPQYRRPPRPSKLDPFRDGVYSCCAWIRGCRASGCASCSRSRATSAARRSSTITCVRCGRCFCGGRARSGARRIGRARSASSTSGSRRARSRSGAARRGAATSSSRAWPIRARAPARWCSRRRRPTCSTGSAVAWRSSARCRRRSSGTARARCTPVVAARPIRSPVGCVNSVPASLTGGFAGGTESRHARVGHALIKRGALLLCLSTAPRAERTEVR
jgi:hypothetical protein